MGTVRGGGVFFGGGGRVDLGSRGAGERGGRSSKKAPLGKKMGYVGERRVACRIPWFTGDITAGYREKIERDEYRWGGVRSGVIFSGKVPKERGPNEVTNLGGEREEEEKGRGFGSDNFEPKVQGMTSRGPPLDRKPFLERREEDTRERLLDRRRRVLGNECGCEGDVHFALSDGDRGKKVGRG